MAADGSIYALKITDAAAANTFFGTKGANLHGSSWNESSDIGKTFKSATLFYLSQYSNSSNQGNLAYELILTNSLYIANSKGINCISYVAD